MDESERAVRLRFRSSLIATFFFSYAVVSVGIQSLNDAIDWWM